MGPSSANPNPIKSGESMSEFILLVADDEIEGVPT